METPLGFMLEECIFQKMVLKEIWTTECYWVKGAKYTVGIQRSLRIQELSFITILI